MGGGGVYGVYVCRGGGVEVFGCGGVRAWVNMGRIRKKISLVRAIA